MAAPGKRRTKRRTVRRPAAKKPPAEAARKGGPAARRPAEAPATAESLARRQREISVAEFFSRNRHLLGFDNPRKALLTAIKEAVDNSLDACEEARILPDITVTLQPLDGADDRYRVVVEDNGPGIVRSQIPRIFAKLLYGSKFHTLKMSRGQQGMGIAAAGMYGQLTTGRPIRILSRTSPRRPAHYYELHVDTERNEPRITREHVETWDKPRGTRVTIDLEARYQRGRQSVDDYLELTAVANPHACLTYTAPGQPPIVYPRAVSDLPAEPVEIKPHPHGLELGALIQMLHSTRSRTLHSFLHGDFCRVSARVATQICEAAGLSPRARPSRIAKQEADRLFRAIRQTKLRTPPTDCLCPIREELLLKGLRKGVEADFYECVTRPPSVYRGHPFQVEAGIAYGGGLPAEQPCRVLRFANRVPLQYQQGACAITRAVTEINWKAYGLSQPAGSLPIGPIAVVVHVASVWVPFTSESKEAIAHYPEILREIKLALQECGRRLGRHVRRRQRHAEAERRRQYIERYLPHITEALGDLLSLSDRQRAETTRRLRDLLERGRST